MEFGRDFQMMVYMLALRSSARANAAMKTEVAGGLFWHVRSLKASGLHLAGKEDDEAAIEMARQHITRNLDGWPQRAIPRARNCARRWKMRALL